MEIKSHGEKGGRVSGVVSGKRSSGERTASYRLIDSGEVVYRGETHSGFPGVKTRRTGRRSGLRDMMACEGRSLFIFHLRRVRQGSCVESDMGKKEIEN